MENVVTLSQKVNGSDPAMAAEAVIAWVETQKDKADMGEAGARMRTTSLRQMLEQVAADEPKDAQWLHDNMEQMRGRWARRNPEGKASTGNTYASRARATIREYLNWIASGGKHDPFSRAEKAKDGSGSKATPSKAKAKPATAQSKQPAPSYQPPTPPQPRVETRTYPVNKEQTRFFTFELPPGGITISEARKVAVHLFTLASDFDIGDDTQRNLFALVAGAGSRE